MTDRTENSQWQRLGALFDQAVGLDAAGQDDLLRAIEPDDSELAQALAALLAADARHQARTAEHRQRVLQDSLDAIQGPDVAVGDRVGAYVLRENLGEGGMGMVFRAERADGQVRQEVALKVIKLGMDTRGVIARFEAERQALAMMDHPHIAQMFDAGATATGRPYFVMELVHGQPISDYCIAHDLPITRRLHLFDQVCAAVQHAHTKGIIHRDLKPGNVLVSVQDGQPLAKIIDFGIAKATSGRLTDKTLLTEQFLMMGTPLYMSPEQAEGSTDLDTRTDIYALGVMLYELLTGTTPIESASLRKAAHVEVQRIIREVDPPRPSVRLSQAITTKAGASRAGDTKGGMESRTQARRLRGDLDWIVMKAIEKDRARRYETANALALDVRRHLAGEPVLAAPPDARYRMRKFVRRHKGAVAAASLIALTLLAGVLAFAWQARIATQQERLARQRADEVGQVARFEADMLKQVNATQAGKQLMDDQQAKLGAALAKVGMPENERARQAATFAGLLQYVNATDTARDLIDRTILKPSAAAIDKQFGHQPLVAATLYQVLAERYYDMALYDAAMPLQRRALAIRRRMLGDRDPDTLTSLSDMGMLLVGQGKPDEAEPYMRQALGTRRRVLGDKHPDTLAAITNMANVLFAEGKLGEAEEYTRDALRKQRLVLGNDHPDTLNSLNDMGVLLRNQGKLSQAEPYLREALKQKRRVLGDENPSTVSTISNLASLLRVEGKLSEAEPYFREALEKDRRLLGEDQPETIDSTFDLGVLLEAQNKWAQAEPVLRDAWEKDRRVLGTDHPDTLISLSELARVLVVRGEYAETEKLLAPREAAFRQNFQGDNLSRLVGFLLRLGNARIGLGQFSAAQANLLEAQPMLDAMAGPDDPKTIKCIQALIDLYTSWNRKEPGKGHDASAAAWKHKLDALAGSGPSAASSSPGRR